MIRFIKTENQYQTESGDCVTAPVIDTAIDPAETIKSLIQQVDVNSWWDGLKDLQKQNMANLVFNQNDEWIDLDKFSIGDPEKKLMWLYSKVL